MLHQDFELGRERAVDMRMEVEHNRLESRLAGARRAKGALSEEFSPRRRGMVARGAAVVMAFSGK